MSVSLDSPDVFFVVLRYVNRRGSDVWGRMTVVEDGRSHHCGNCKCWEGTVSMAAQESERWEVFLLSLDFLATLRSLRFGCVWLLVVAAPCLSSGHRSVQVSGI